MNDHENTKPKPVVINAAPASLSAKPAPTVETDDELEHSSSDVAELHGGGSGLDALPEGPVWTYKGETH